MRRAKMPLDGTPEPATFSEFVKDRVEQGAKPRAQATVTFSVADTRQRVRHRLPWVPEGFQVIEQDGAGNIYRDRVYRDTTADTPKADKHWIYLKSTAAGLTVTLEFF